MAKPKPKTDPSMTNPNLMPWHDMNERQVQASAAKYTGTAKKAPRERRDIPYNVGSKAGPPDRNTKKHSTYNNAPGGVPKGKRYVEYEAEDTSDPKWHGWGVGRTDQAQSEYNADRRVFDQDQFDPADRGPYNHMMDDPHFVPQSNTPEQQQSIDLLIQRLMQLRNQ